MIYLYSKMSYTVATGISKIPAIMLLSFSNLTQDELNYIKAAIILLVFLLFIPLAYAIQLIKAYRDNKKNKKLKALVNQTMLSFAKAIDAKDTYTKGHSERVAQYSSEIARRYDIPKSRISDLYCIALLHDIGKIGIPDNILNKPGKLNEEEFEIIKTHTTVGANILSELTAVENIELGARDHHERYDGTGYPNGLAGEEISIEGRIIGAADAYDAMASKRVYRSVFSKEQIRKEFEKESGKQFDPKIVEIIINMLDEGYFDNGCSEKTKKLKCKKSI